MDGQTSNGRLTGSVKSFSCPNCGGIVEVRAPGQTLSAGCIHCGTVVDITNENFRIIQQFNQKMRPPLIPLGKRGKLGGNYWEVIGMMTRKSVLWNFVWDEYLLFNPIQGFRWLVNTYGHWTLVEGMMEKPTYSKDGKTVFYQNKNFKRFSGGEALVTYVIGEFYWFVEVGDKTKVYEFINPPEIVSAEVEEGGLFWAKGEHIDEKVIQEAFQLDKAMPKKTGVGAVQPNNARKRAKEILPFYLMLLTASILLQVLFSTTAKNKEVYSEFVTLNKPDTTLVVEPFHLDGSNTNLSGKLRAPDISDNWVEADVHLLNLATQAEYMLPLTVQYYTGYDGGEYWSEGSRTTHVLANRIPGGDYRMEISIVTDSLHIDSYGSENVNISLVRDTTFGSNFIWVLILISIVPLFLWIRSRSIEKKRWKDAD